MEVRDVWLPVRTADPKRDVGGEMDGASDSPARLADLAEVDRLVLDLTALIESGLVTVQEPVFGPARYGVVGPG
jgi:hypothetical protein